MIVLGTALALPHAPGMTTPLLAMQTPVFVVLLIVVVAPVTLAYTAGESGIASQVAVLGVAVVLLVGGSTCRSDLGSVSTPERADRPAIWPRR